jgi:hypothetical protein
VNDAGGAGRISSLRDEILLLDGRLSAAVPFRSKMNSDGEAGGRGRMPHSPAPWNVAAAECRLDLHALVRRTEDEWRAGIRIPVRKRGGSDRNTAAGLKALERIASAVPEGMLVNSLRELTRWTRSARMILGDLERPRRLPRAEGEKEMPCPYCEVRSLRIWMLDGIVRCNNPACARIAVVEYVTETGDVVLEWRRTGAA